MTFETTLNLTLYAQTVTSIRNICSNESTSSNKEHYDRLWLAIKNNVVDVLGSDHAPHAKKNKDKAYPDSPSGMPGVQTIFPLLLIMSIKGN